jgi:hypothetical protein
MYPSKSHELLNSNRNSPEMKLTYGRGEYWKPEVVFAFLTKLHLAFPKTLLSWLPRVAVMDAYIHF